MSVTVERKAGGFGGGGNHFDPNQPRDRKGRWVETGAELRNAITHALGTVLAHIPPAGGIGEDHYQVQLPDGHTENWERSSVEVQKNADGSAPSVDPRHDAPKLPTLPPASDNIDEARAAIANLTRGTRTGQTQSHDVDAARAAITQVTGSHHDEQAGADRPGAEAGADRPAVPGAGGRSGAPDRRGDGPDSGDGPARGDVRAEGGPAEPSPADRGGAGRRRRAAGGTSSDAGDGPGPDAAGTGAGRGDAGVPRGAAAPGGGTAVAERPAGPADEHAARHPADEHAARHPADASRAAPGGPGVGDAAAAGAPDAVGQPAPDRGQVDAIPAAGQAFRPGGVDDLAPAGKRAKLDANMAALRTLRTLQAEHRPATPDEQATLARWAGWGGLPEVFDDAKPEYAAERAELRGLLSEAEWREARRNTLNAHYTDARAAQAMWDALRELGFDGGRVLEPGSGAGTFIGLAPGDAHMVGVELDSTTAAISKALYPDADIRNESFADTRVPNGSFDAVIGNVPYGRLTLTDKVHNRAGESIHNHFILKSLDLTRPGGLVAVLTSRYTMDSRSSRARQAMAERADLVGAIRLPSGSHARTAGTDVIEDILIFRKRAPGEAPQEDRSWINTTKVSPDDPRIRGEIEDVDVTLNDYWEAHPDNVLGETQIPKGRYGTGDIEVIGDAEMAELPDALARIVTDAHRDGLAGTPRPEGQPLPELISPLAGRHEGHIEAKDDGTFSQATRGASTPLEVPRGQAEELRNLLGLRDTVTALLAAESQSAEDTPQIQQLRGALNDRYDAYVASHGPINRFTLAKNGARIRPGQGGFRSDPMSATVKALEEYDPVTGDATKADIFTTRAVAPRQLRTTASTPQDALTLSLEQHGAVSLPAIAQMLGTDEAEARRRLGNLVYEQPPLTKAEEIAALQQEALRDAGDLAGVDVSEAPDLSSVGETVRQEGGLVPSAEYLSGNVRRKLAAARVAAEADPRFRTNVEALEAVLPEDLGIEDIEPRVGAVWVPPEDYQAFLAEILETRNVDVAGGAGFWTVKGPKQGTLATETWGTPDKPAPELLQAMLTQAPIKVTHKDSDGKSIPDQEATEAAIAKADELQARFQEWVWEDPDRAKRLQRAYNVQFNGIVLREYDGAGRQYPGMSDDWQTKMRPHQHAAVERIVNEPTALLAHVVGAGKTAEMVTGAGELKRLGLARKPAMVIPNHMLEQATREALEVYPQARVLSAGSDDLTGDKRREFIARAATGDWDIVILTQGAFNKIPMDPDNVRAYMDRELQFLRDELQRQKDAPDADDEKSARGKTIKRMETSLANAEEKLKAMAEQERDVAVSWEQTGIDYLMVDEAQDYLNLRTISAIPGAGASGSQMATDLHMKLDYLRQTSTTGRVATFATGTPIRNTVTQAYIMMRYLRPDLLHDAGIDSFDQWAATFGEVVQEMELKPEGTGYRQTARFAKFKNVPEFLRLFRTFTDVKTAEDLNLPTPNLRGGKPEVIAVPRSDSLAQFIDELGARAEAVRSGQVEPEVDNMLKIATDGRKAALSMKLVGGDHEPGKLEAAAGKIGEIWKANKDKKYTERDGSESDIAGALQIVFMDLGTPKTAKSKDAGQSVDDNDSDWNGYDHLKAELVARGVPADGIRYMHEAKNDQQKAEMFAAARSGRIAVLIGSTSRMGVGTNVQKRAVAMHHIDAPWRPADVEQRDGRIMRQGNQNPDIDIFRYVTEGSFDAYMWQTLERKAKFINQVLKGRLDVREIEDIGDTALNYAEIKALATGNPDLLDKAKVDTLAAKLERLSRAHNRTQVNLHRDIGRAELSIGQWTSAIGVLDGLLARRQDTRGKAFKMRVGGKDFDKRPEAGEALKARLLSVLEQDRFGARPRRDIGQLGGLDLEAQVKSTSHGLQVGVYLPGYDTPLAQMDLGKLGESQPQSLVLAMENGIAGLDGKRQGLVDSIENAQTELGRMRGRIGGEFARAAELARAKRKSARLALKLQRDAKRSNGDDIPFDPAIDSDQFDEADGDLPDLPDVVPDDPKPTGPRFTHPDRWRNHVEKLLNSTPDTYGNEGKRNGYKAILKAPKKNVTLSDGGGLGVVGITRSKSREWHVLATGAAQKLGDVATFGNQEDAQAFANYLETNARDGDGNLFDWSADDIADQVKSRFPAGDHEFANAGEYLASVRADFDRARGMVGNYDANGQRIEGRPWSGYVARDDDRMKNAVKRRENAGRLAATGLDERWSWDERLDQPTTEAANLRPGDAILTYNMARPGEVALPATWNNPKPDGDRMTARTVQTVEPSTYNPARVTLTFTDGTTLSTSDTAIAHPDGFPADHPAEIPARPDVPEETPAPPEIPDEPNAPQEPPAPETPSPAEPPATPEPAATPEPPGTRWTADPATGARRTTVSQLQPGDVVATRPAQDPAEGDSDLANFEVAGLHPDAHTDVSATTPKMVAQVIENPDGRTQYLTFTDGTDSTLYEANSPVWEHPAAHGATQETPSAPETPQETPARPSAPERAPEAPAPPQEPAAPAAPAGPEQPDTAGPAMSKFTPAEQDQIRNAVEDYAGRYGSVDPARYITEGHLADLAGGTGPGQRDRYDEVRAAVQEHLDAHPELAETRLTHDQVDQRQKERAKPEWRRLTEQAQAATRAKDYDRALELIDQAQEAADGHEGGPPADVWDRLRANITGARDRHRETDQAEARSIREQIEQRQRERSPAEEAAATGRWQATPAGHYTLPLGRVEPGDVVWTTDTSAGVRLPAAAVLGGHLPPRKTPRTVERIDHADNHVAVHFTDGTSTEATERTPAYAPSDAPQVTGREEDAAGRPEDTTPGTPPAQPEQPDATPPPPDEPPPAAPEPDRAPAATGDEPAAVQMADTTIQDWEAVGGKAWQQNGHHRYYLNDLGHLAWPDASKLTPGNRAELRGIYWDANTGELVKGRNTDLHTFERIENGLLEEIAARRADIRGTADVNDTVLVDGRRGEWIVMERAPDGQLTVRTPAMRDSEAITVDPQQAILVRRGNWEHDSVVAGRARDDAIRDGGVPARVREATALRERVGQRHPATRDQTRPTPAPAPQPQPEPTPVPEQPAPDVPAVPGPAAVPPADSRAPRPSREQRVAELEDQARERAGLDARWKLTGPGKGYWGAPANRVRKGDFLYTSGDGSAAKPVELPGNKGTLYDHQKVPREVVSVEQMSGGMVRFHFADGTSTRAVGDGRPTDVNGRSLVLAAPRPEPNQQVVTDAGLDPARWTEHAGIPSTTAAQVKPGDIIATTDKITDTERRIGTTPGKVKTWDPDRVGGAAPDLSRMQPRVVESVDINQNRRPPVQINFTDGTFTAGLGEESRVYAHPDQPPAAPALPDPRDLTEPQIASRLTELDHPAGRAVQSLVEAIDGADAETAADRARVDRAWEAADRHLSELSGRLDDAGQHDAAHFVDRARDEMRDHVDGSGFIPYRPDQRQTIAEIPNLSDQQLHDAWSSTHDYPVEQAYEEALRERGWGTDGRPLIGGRAEMVNPQRPADVRPGSRVLYRNRAANEPDTWALGDLEQDAAGDWTITRKLGNGDVIEATQIEPDDWVDVASPSDERITGMVIDSIADQALDQWTAPELDHAVIEIGGQLRALHDAGNPGGSGAYRDLARQYDALVAEREARPDEPGPVDPGGTLPLDLEGGDAAAEEAARQRDRARFANRVVANPRIDEVQQRAAVEGLHDDALTAERQTNLDRMAELYRDGRGDGDPEFDALRGRQQAISQEQEARARAGIDKPITDTPSYRVNRRDKVIAEINGVPGVYEVTSKERTGGTVRLGLLGEDGTRHDYEVSDSDTLPVAPGDADPEDSVPVGETLDDVETTSPPAATPSPAPPPIDITPHPEGTATARPVLYTYQRKNLVAFALDHDETQDDVVRQAAARVRARQTLSGEQAHALAEAVRARAEGGGLRPVQQRAMHRLAWRFDAAAAQAEGSPPPDLPNQAVAAVRPGDLGAGDQVALARPRRGGPLVGKVVGIRSMMRGRLHEVTVELPDGTRETQLVTGKTDVYVLPDVPDPEPIAPPPIPEPVAPAVERARLSSRDRNSAEALTRTLGDIVTQASVVPYRAMLADELPVDVDDARIDSWLDDLEERARTETAVRTSVLALRSQAGQVWNIPGTLAEDALTGVANDLHQRTALAVVTSLRVATPGAGETRRDAIERTMRFIADNPPTIADLEIAGESLAAVGAALREARHEHAEHLAEPPAVPTPDAADLNGRMAAYRDAIGGEFGLARKRVAAPKVGNIGDLAAGRIPEVVWAEMPTVDRAEDGGPGETAMQHLEIVRAAGADLAARMDQHLAEFNHPGLRDGETHQQAVARIHDDIRQAHGTLTPRERFTLDRMIDNNVSEVPESQREALPNLVALVGLSKQLDQLQAAIDGARREAAMRTLREAGIELGGEGLTYRPARGGTKMRESNDLVKAMRWAESAYPSTWLARVRQYRPSVTLDKGKRGHVNDQDTHVRLSSRPRIEGATEFGAIAQHELGHLMEHAIPGLMAAQQAFLWSRAATGDIGERVMERPTPIHGKDKEIGVRDGLKNHYTGRQYAGRNYEVFTTAIENLLGGTDWYLDDDLRNWTLGVLGTLGHGPAPTDKR